MTGLDRSEVRPRYPQAIDAVPRPGCGCGRTACASGGHPGAWCRLLDLADDGHSEVHREPPVTRLVPTGRTVISGPSTSTVWFVCWSVRSTTIRELRFVVTTGSLCEPQTMIRTGSGCLFSVSRDREQRGCVVLPGVAGRGGGEDDLCVWASAKRTGHR